MDWFVEPWWRDRDWELTCRPRMISSLSISPIKKGPNIWSLTCMCVILRSGPPSISTRTWYGLSLWLGIKFDPTKLLSDWLISPAVVERYAAISCNMSSIFVTCRRDNEWRTVSSCELTTMRLPLKRESPSSFQFLNTLVTDGAILFCAKGVVYCSNIHINVGNCSTRLADWSLDGNISSNWNSLLVDLASKEENKQWMKGGQLHFWSSYI